MQLIGSREWDAVELMYVFIDRYRNTFKEQEFNFSSELRFKYNKAAHEFRIERNEMHIPNFFQHSREGGSNEGRIKNITGIIGKNGAGKTTILDFIKDNFVEGAGGLIECAIVVTRDERGQGYIHCHRDLKIEKGNWNDKSFRFHDPIYYTELGNIHSMPQSNPMENTAVVFFSTIFDAKQEREWSGMRNISTNYLVKDAKRKQAEMGHVDAGASETELYRRDEIKRQLNFIRSYDASGFELPFPIPERATVIARPVEALLHASLSHTKDRYKSFNDLHRHTRDWLKAMEVQAKGRAESVKHRFFSAVVYTFLNEMMSYFLDWIPEERVPVDFDKLYQGNEELYLKILELMNSIGSSMVIQEYKNKDMLNWIDGAMELVRMLDRCITPENTVDYTFHLPLFTDDKNEIAIMDIMDAHLRASVITSFLDFDWRDLSSGQKALLSTYARFHSIADEQERFSNLHLEDNVLILIDEGELYLHPEWQKRYLNSLIEYLPQIYTNRNIQIIMTSNSPVIISDLPKSHLIFIDKTDKGCKVIDGLLENKQTFAANIHTLFSDAFFMDTGLIGEFAHQKILALINQINSLPSEALYAQSSEMEILIGQIGEPVLRSKLSSMLKDRIGPYLEREHSNQQLIEIILKMQHEIKELKKGIRNNDHH
ncbi:AAA family ATPase [Paenibacillus oenotherae]|uniref:AAA family ATPase n=1 Tax=Paenibacillus oenotherae TaxID=1435645 RepID=A0ABS7D342_9BACL|nr:AAA family ATPase [Paenibacillus oenotherae]MBW7473856.1 AAA family ATPase [Paenibacillus oenotherae]